MPHNIWLVTSASLNTPGREGYTAYVFVIPIIMCRLMLFGIVLSILQIAQMKYLRSHTNL